MGTDSGFRVAFGGVGRTAPHPGHTSVCETHLCGPVPQSLGCCGAFALITPSSLPFPHPLVFLDRGLLKSTSSVLSLAWSLACNKCLMSTWICRYVGVCSSAQELGVAYPWAIAQRHSHWHQTGPGLSLSLAEQLTLSELLTHVGSQNLGRSCVCLQSVHGRWGQLPLLV